MKKTCNVCLISYPLSNFFHHKIKNRCYYRYCCKRCWRIKNQSRISLEKVRAYHLKSQYGLSRQDFLTLLCKQSDRCAICKNPPKTRLHVDHNHRTGAVRGLLCSHCNKGLGFFFDNPEYLTNAATYLWEN